MNFTDLATLEPRLLTLEADIRRVRGDKRKRSFCANHVWYNSGGFKARLLSLIGWNKSVTDERLRTSEAYDVAYEHLYNLLPDCRGCLCL